MSEFLVTPQEAKDFISSEHPDGYEIPRSFNLGSVGNHLAAALILIAVSDYSRDLRHLFISIRSLRKTNFDEIVYGEDILRETLRTNATKSIDAAIADAEGLLDEGKEKSMLDGIQYTLANKWKLDDYPVKIIAVNSSGDAVRVTHMGGFMHPTDKDWINVARGIEYGIAEAFDE